MIWTIPSEFLRTLPSPSWRRVIVVLPEQQVEFVSGIQRRIASWTVMLSSESRMAWRFGLPLSPTLLTTGRQYVKVRTKETSLPYLVNALWHALQQKVLYCVFLPSLYLWLSPFMVYFGQLPQTQFSTSFFYDINRLLFHVVHSALSSLLRLFLSILLAIDCSPVYEKRG